MRRPPNQRLYIGPHVQECLAGLDAEWEHRLTRSTLGVQNALKPGDTRPFSSDSGGIGGFGGGNRPSAGERPAVKGAA